MGDNMLKMSDNLTWWKGTNVFIEAHEFQVDMLHDVLDNVQRFRLGRSVRRCVCRIYKINAVGDVLVGSGTGWRVH